MTKNKTNKMDGNCADVFNKTNFLCQKFETINKQIECYTEYYLCGKMAAEYLHKIKRENFIYVGGEESDNTNIFRRKGVLDYFQTKFLEVKNYKFINTHASINDGYKAITSLAKNTTLSNFNSIICSNNHIAVGVLRALEDLKMILDEDRKVVLAREISKIHEEFIREKIDDILEKVDNLKGEMVLIIEGNYKKKKNDLCNLSINEHYKYYEEQGLEKKEIITFRKERNSFYFKNRQFLL